jgi:hypothetical protein
MTNGKWAYAQSVSTVTSANKTKASSAAPYEGIYVVITSQTDKGMLEEIENKLKRWGIYFKPTEISFTNGLLTNITLEVEVPGVYKATSTYGNGKEPLSEPVIFYHETSTGAGLSSQIPEQLSARGKMVVTNNLKGILILYDGDNMESIGTFYTNWKSK